MDKAVMTERTEDKSSSSTPRTDRMTNGDKAFEKWWQTWRNANGWADTLRMRTAARSLWDGIAFSSIETAFEKLRAQGHIQTEETAVPSVAQPRPRGDVMDLAYGIIEGDDNWTAARIVANELIRLECAPSHVAPQENANVAEPTMASDPNKILEQAAAIADKYRGRFYEHDAQGADIGAEIRALKTPVRR